MTAARKNSGALTKDEGAPELEQLRQLRARTDAAKVSKVGA